MPDRTKEELEEIYKDLLEMRTVANKLRNLGHFSATYWKTRRAEKKEFYQVFVDEWRNLLTADNRVNSCECTMEVKGLVKKWEEIRDKPYSLFRLPQYQLDSSEIVSKNGLTLDNLVSSISKIINRAASEDEIKRVNEALDQFGNCDIVLDDQLIRDAKDLAFDAHNVAILDPPRRLDTKCLNFKGKN